MYPIVKRFFDVLAAGALLLLLSPLFLIVAILIRLESRGPVFYAAKRVGQNYAIFDFYKFRSMRVNADQEVNKLKKNNQYQDAAPKLKVLVTTEEEDDIQLFSDAGWIPETVQQEKIKQEIKKPFFKVKNDPRITRVGQFIRNTSIDELPQLINVLKGDMSLVGNRPLPLYEAEKLTSDESILRFSAPAGITGLWQVTERGKSTQKESSRKELDVQYALTYSFTLDLWILFRTPLAALQQDNV